MAMRRMAMRTKRRMAIGIQTGDSTHHHGQAMTPQSLRVMKVMASHLENPMPRDIFEPAINFVILKLLRRGVRIGRRLSGDALTCQPELA
jgi:hypothetical protein